MHTELLRDGGGPDSFPSSPVGGCHFVQQRGPMSYDSVTLPSSRISAAGFSLLGMAAQSVSASAEKLEKRPKL